MITVINWLLEEAYTHGKRKDLTGGMKCLEKVNLYYWHVLLYQVRVSISQAAMALGNNLICCFLSLPTSPFIPFQPDPSCILNESKVQSPSLMVCIHCWFSPAVGKKREWLIQDPWATFGRTEPSFQLWGEQYTPEQMYSWKDSSNITQLKPRDLICIFVHNAYCPSLKGCYAANKRKCFELLGKVNTTSA